MIKIYEVTKCLNEMAFSRVELIKKVESFSERINDEIIKLTVYENNEWDKNHWIERLSTWLYSVDKPVFNNNKKLKPNQYEKYVFGTFGNEKDDAEINLYSFKANNTKYDDFEVAEELIDKLFNTYNKIKQLCDVFATNSKRELSFFQEYVKDIFGNE